jgi:putative nucleotidyltransferase with HDIG domain
MTRSGIAFDIETTPKMAVGSLTASAPPWPAEEILKLSQLFSTDFVVFNGDTGELHQLPPGRTLGDWDLRGQLCRAVATNGQVSFIEEDEPLLVMALPLYGDDGASAVAVGMFVTANDASAPQVRRAAESLGLDPAEARQWIERQIRWVPDMLLRMGQLAVQQADVTRRLKALEQEARELSMHLSSSYEEISLLYRLTQHLKLSNKKAELAGLTLEWLADVLPAESLAIQFTDPHGGREGESEPLLLTLGSYPLSMEDLADLRAQFDVVPAGRPLIVNTRMTQSADWRWPAVRQMVVAPLSEGDRSFGWLVACNHRQGAEFGTVEAIMLSSVAAILGIHSGNTQLYEDQRELFSGVVRALTSAIDAKDAYTCGHSDRVARVAKRLAEELGCDRRQIDTIYLSGLLHDVGKIGVDDEVLRKPGKLTADEYDQIKTHAEIGYKILRDIKQLDEVLPVVLHHHEQWDGKGYPLGLAGETIPFLARVVAVADAFDAMGSDRPYRQGMPDDKLDSIMQDGAGTQWDADVVAAFFTARDAIREIAQAKADRPPFDYRG